ncbi:alpha-galactosidase [Mucilaginibacter sp. KACC 22773]|uniref:alpha-galactosidase n=1 Tax=Mucilaginibacter sp. KACC 22773 TaxID=3025671 RepID=UPI0023666EFC|nr:alpha-galactosidase [Mucilaginibacter sp. KACC 22773]WDF75703.1 alpha-galactosidase [Mucilaginibacter sp. KACC 22773]
MSKLVLFIYLAFFCGGTVLKAQSNKQIIIATKNVNLVFTVGANNRVYQAYLGKRFLNQADNSLIPNNKHEAYIAGGMEDLLQPAIRLIHSDGNPSLELRYVNHTTKNSDQNISETNILLQDPKYSVQVILHYQAFSSEDIIKSWAEIKNDEKSEITLENYASSMLHFEAKDYWLTQFHGDWASEMKMQESKLTSGVKEIDSKLGTRADMYQTPVFFLALNKPADETTGELLAGTLAWTGNFQFHFEIDERNALRVISGINPYASAYKLKKGETFTTPAFIFTYSTTGKGQASRDLHQWARNYGVLDGNKPRLTLLNNWEATHVNFNEKELVGLFDDATKLGVDLFLLDDGWFGNKYPRDNDKAGLGDWQENKAKLPNGIGYLVKQAEAKGLKFGIWLEPEMVNPKSELYEQHPDWILKLPNRDENYQRNQLVLDLTNPKVADYVYHTVVDMLTKNPGLAYIKWDCNRSMSNTWSPNLKDRQSALFVDYTLSLYKILDRIRQKYPHLPIMLCSGGGGRTDYGALKYFTEFWPSDDTDPLERVYIQWGYSNFFPALTISSHVTSWGKQSIKFRTDVAMMGKLGYDIKVSKMTDDELQFSKQTVKNYNRLRNTIWFGDLYRIISPYDENRMVAMYVNAEKSKAVLFNYNLNTRYKEVFNRVRLQGLDSQKKYKVEETNLMPGAKSNLAENGRVFSGDYLMTMGLNLTPGKLMPLTSMVIEINAEN